MISIILPVYKKTDLFIKNIRHNLPFMNDCEVIIVNDDPSESIRNHLSGLPIILLENKTNLGFAGAVNKGVRKATNKYIVLLNSDVILNNANFKNATKHFKNKDLFAVSFAQKEKNGKIVGKNTIFWKNGFFQHSAAQDLKEGINGWAEGGACMIDKEKFEKIGGFDEVYSPFYWEDIDLSYRAWKSGYTILFDPKVEFEHYHGSTIDEYFSPKSVKTIAYRNQFIFVWKNINSFSLMVDHILRLPINLLITIAKGDTLLTKGFLSALKRNTLRLAKTNTHLNTGIYTDKQILDRFK